MIKTLRKHNVSACMFAVVEVGGERWVGRDGRGDRWTRRQMGGETDGRGERWVGREMGGEREMGHVDGRRAGRRAGRGAWCLSKKSCSGALFVLFSSKQKRPLFRLTLIYIMNVVFLYVPVKWKISK